MHLQNQLRRLGFGILLFSLIIGSGGAQAQMPPFWGGLQPGPYSVGYKDRVVIHPKEQFTYKDYTGGKPFFISIWYPAEAGEAPTPMKYAEFMEYPVTDPNLQSLSTDMQSMTHQMLKNYGVCTNIDTWKTLKYRKPQQGIFEAILATEMFAKRDLSLASKAQFPCVVYHHGAGGSVDENAIFYEYLASQGWVVVSSNFHWIVDRNGTMGFGNTFPDTTFSYMTDLRFVADFAANLPYVNADQLVFAGHSWGGQAGLEFNADAFNRFKLFLLYDTTMEGKPLSFIKRFAPTLYGLPEKQADRMLTPTVIITSQDKSMASGPRHKKTYFMPKFTYFRQFTQTPLTFITHREGIDHSDFISQGVYRASFVDEFKQKDQAAILKDFEAYQQILLLTHTLLNLHLSGEAPHQAKPLYSFDFIFETVP